MSASSILHLPLYELVTPCVIAVLLASVHLYQFIVNKESNKRNLTARSFFQMVHEGWVASNHMKDRSSNTTRDYLKVSTFLAGNAVILATVLAGFGAQVLTALHMSLFTNCWSQALSQASLTAYQSFIVLKLGRNE